MWLGRRDVRELHLARRNLQRFVEDLYELHPAMQLAVLVRSGRRLRRKVPRSRRQLLGHRHDLFGYRGVPMRGLRPGSLLRRLHRQAVLQGHPGRRQQLRSVWGQVSVGQIVREWQVRLRSRFALLPGLEWKRWRLHESRDGCFALRGLLHHVSWDAVHGRNVRNLSDRNFGLHRREPEVRRSPDGRSELRCLQQRLPDRRCVCGRSLCVSVRSNLVQRPVHQYADRLEALRRLLHPMSDGGELRCRQVPVSRRNLVLQRPVHEPPGRPPELRKMRDNVLHYLLEWRLPLRQRMVFSGPNACAAPPERAGALGPANFYSRTIGFRQAELIGLAAQFLGSSPRTQTPSAQSPGAPAHVPLVDGPHAALTGQSGRPELSSFCCAADACERLTGVVSQQPRLTNVQSASPPQDAQSAGRTSGGASSVADAAVGGAADDTVPGPVPVGAADELGVIALGRCVGLQAARPPRKKTTNRRRTTPSLDDERLSVRRKGRGVPLPSHGSLPR